VKTFDVGLTSDILDLHGRTFYYEHVLKFWCIRSTFPNIYEFDFFFVVAFL